MPLIALYKKQCKEIFNKLLKTDERRLRVAVNACQSKNIVLELEHDLFTINVNTKNELKMIEDAYNS